MKLLFSLTEIATLNVNKPLFFCRYEEIEQQRLRQLDDELAIQRMEEEHLRTKQQREEEDYQAREQQRLEEIEEQKMREREAELRRLEDIIVEEQQRKISLKEESTRRVQEEEQLRQRRIHEIEMETKRVKEEQQREWELEQQRMREIEETTIIQQRRQLELEQARRAKEQEQERQRRLEQEREERERYILEKLKQEQELLELQKRQKLIQEQREREEYELEYRQRQQQEAHAHSKQHQVIGIDNISTITKRITEEKHNSMEVFEEEHIERLPIHQSDTIEKQINIQLPDHPTYHNQHHHHSHHHSSHNNNNVTSESSSSCTRNRQDSRHESNVIDHCVSSSNGHKHVLIVNSYKPKHSNSNNSHVSPVVSNVHTTLNSRSQSPPKMRSSCDALCSTTASNSQAMSHKTESMSPKYAIKHKANRYVSGAIGILETSLNGEYIILENLSSNKNVNLKGWYIHRYVPDQNINLIFKFVNDTMLCCGEKLKILSRSCSTKIRSTSMYESVNAVGQESSSSSASFKPKDKYMSDGNEKIIIATNIENWGTYSKFSVTKLINPDGVDKAVLTQSLLRLASSTSNVNVSSPRESSPNMSLTHKQQHQQQSSSNSSYYYNRAVSNSNLSQRPAQTPSYYEQYSPRTETVSSSTKKTTRTTEHSNSMSHLTTMSSAPYVVDGSHNAHVTRQF